MATPTPTITADVADAASALLSTLTAATGRAADQLRGYVDQYAADYAEVVALMATAKLSGDPDALAVAEDELDILNEDALLDAADAGIEVQTATEQKLEDVLTGVVGLLVSRLLA